MNILEELFVHSSLLGIGAYNNSNVSLKIYKSPIKIGCNTCLSSAQRVPPSTEETVAARGALYIKASSPNEPLLSYEATFKLSPFIT